MSQIGEILALDMPFQFSYIRPSGTESLSIEGLKIPPEDNPVRDHHLPLNALRRLIFEAEIAPWLAMWRSPRNERFDNLSSPFGAITLLLTEGIE